MMISLPGCFLQSNRRASAAQNMHTQASEKHGCIFFYSSLPGRALRQENSRLMMTEEGRSAENIGASPSANPPHYSQSLLASCASLRRQYRWLCAFRFHAYIHVWICSFGRLRREKFFFFFFLGNKHLSKRRDATSVSGRRDDIKPITSVGLCCQFLSHSGCVPKRCIPLNVWFTITPHSFCVLWIKIPVRVVTSSQNTNFLKRKLWKKKPYRYLFFFQKRPKLFPLTLQKSKSSVLWPHKCLDLLPVRPNWV